MEKLRIEIPAAYAPETGYTFRCLLSEFLGIEIEIEEVNALSHFKISFKKSFILIKNHFFSKELPVEELYTKQYIPHKTSTEIFKIGNQKLTYEHFYGHPSYDIKENSVTFDSDIISAAFFMLSRWEEFAIDSRDEHDRFNYQEALSVKNNFYKRAVVNEYLQLLKYALLHIGYKEKFKKRQYSPVVTFDIDETRKWKSFRGLIVWIVYNFRHFNFIYIIEDKLSFVISLWNKWKDPFNNFSYILTTLARNKIKDAIFYFKVSPGAHKLDRNEYDLNDTVHQSIISKIKADGFKIGHHPNYNVFKDLRELKSEKAKLEKAITKDVVDIRQHFLRFILPETWRVQDKVGYTYDSTMLYSFEAGFRNGVCYDFPVFDILERKQLKLRERPLLFMETKYVERLNEAKTAILNLKNEVIKYNGTLTILWHNGNLVYMKQRRVFEKVLKIICD